MFTAVTEQLTRKDVKEGGFILSHDLGIQSIMAGRVQQKPWLTAVAVGAWWGRHGSRLAHRVAMGAW